jgi:excisionase family DNA binding protein
MLTATQVATLLGLKPRTVYDFARRGLIPSHRFGDAVRFDPAGVPLTERSRIDYWWRKARAAVELEHATLHDLRHSAASAMVNAGIDLATVGAVLGHKSAASTKRYSHWQTGRLADALATIGRKVPHQQRRKVGR